MNIFRRKILPSICICLCLAWSTSGGATAPESFKTTEYYKSTGLEYIKAADAYALGYTGKGVRLALFDQIVRFDHSEFVNKSYLQGYVNFANAGWDINRHGTHVAGIMAASKDGVGMHGVAFDAGILSLGTNLELDENGTYDIAALYPKTFADNSLKIINNSWGEDLVYPEYYRNAQEYLTFFNTFRLSDISTFKTAILDHDKVIVWAAGNSGHLSAQHYANLGMAVPQLSGNIVNVVAFDPSKKTTDVNFLAEFSDHALFVEENSIASPGVAIYSAVPYGEGRSYEKWSGTSMATPYVSGTLGLVQQAFPYMTGKQLVDTVLSTANNTFALPRYTVGVQMDYSQVDKEYRASNYLVYFTNEVLTPQQREQDLRDYYANSPYMKIQFGSLEKFLDKYYQNFEGYGNERYYVNVPREIMFGQGLLDAGKAVRGPGLFNARRLTDADYSNTYSKAQALYKVDTQGYNSIWSNDIAEKRVAKYSSAYLDFYKAFYGGLYAQGRYGAGLSYADGEAYGQTYYDSLNTAIENNILYNLPVGLLKTGNGTLALTGNNSYQGDSVVVGGMLQIDGSVSSNVYSEINGTVAGSGSIGGNLINRGTTQAGSWGTSGNLSIQGDLLSSGIIAVTVEDSGSNSQILVNGKAEVAGSKITTSGIVIPNARYQFLSATQGITGDFVATSISPFLSLNPTHDANIASFLVNKTASLTSVNNLNGSQQISADELEKMYNSLPSQQLPVELAAIYNSKTKLLAGAALQETYGGAQASMTRLAPLNSVIGQSINARMSSLGSPSYASAYNQSERFSLLLNNLQSNRYVNTVVPLNFDLNNSWWVKLNAGSGNIVADSSRGLAAVDGKSSGFVVGYDQKINSNWRSGLILGYGKVKMSTANTTGNSRDYRFGIYTGYNHQAVDVNAYIAAGKQANDTLRHLPSLGLTASSDYGGQTLEFGVRAKYNLHYQQKKNWELAPYAELNVQRNSQDGFTEKGAGVLSQQAERLVNVATTAELGLEASRKVHEGKYTLWAGYKRALSGNNPELRMSFAGNPSSKFAVSGNEQSCERLVLGVMAEGNLAKNWTVYGEVQGEFSAKGKNNSASISLRHSW